MIPGGLLLALLLAGGGEPADHVVIISVDGLRPDAIRKAGARHLEDMARRGASCADARTGIPPLTYPSHLSMLTGLASPTHGVTENDPVEHNLRPTVFSIARAAGLTTAMYYAKPKIGHLAFPGDLDFIYGPRSRSPGSVSPWVVFLVILIAVAATLAVAARRRLDEEGNPRERARTLRWASVSLAGGVGLSATLMFSAPPPPVDNTSRGIVEAFGETWTAAPFNLTFIHLLEPDAYGHHQGWMSPPYLESVREVDAAVATLEEVVRKAGLRDRTAIIVTADHGGVGMAHSDDRPENLSIPWICVGPGVPAGLVIRRTVRTQDTAPTALAFLGLKAPEGIDGRPVTEVLK